MENCISSMPDSDDPISETTFDIMQSSDRIKIHVNEHDNSLLINGVSILTCIFCDSVFGGLECLAAHMQIHTLPDRVDVDIKETDITNIDSSSSRWTDALPKFHVCDECGRSFSQACNLKTHMRMHRGDRPFQCSECDRCFTSKGNMQTHSLTHKGARPFACLQCDKSFTQIGSLKVHKRTHTGERPYGCEECIRQFTKASDLRRHAKTHSSDKPFKCSHCTRSFLDSSSLDLHLRRHSNYRPYSCFVCDKKFTRIVCLKKHVKIHGHSGESQLH